MKHKGMTLLSLVVSLAILGTVFTVLLTVYNQFTQKIVVANEITRLNNHLKEIKARLTALGFWVWDVDTQRPRFPDNPADPAVVWAEELRVLGIKRGIMTVTFLKQEDNQWLPFSTKEFDQNLPRDAVRVTISLYGDTGQEVSQNLFLTALPIRQRLLGHLYLLKRALLLYYNDNNIYPASLSHLVPSILVEIPNDPYTFTKKKVSHLEEITDWTYSLNTNLRQISLYANSHSPFSFPDMHLTWTY